MSNARELSELAGSYGTGGFVGMKNRIINGAMVIDQRNAGASVTPSSATYSLDRWNSQVGNASAFSLQQSSTAASGFVKSLLVTSLAATSVGSSNSNTVEQYVEGLNCSDLGWGAAGAASVTLSFWVRSSLTGTFGGCVQNSDNTRSYVFSYTISAANTWEQKTVTIAGDTSGTWLTTNGVGIKLRFSIGNGSSYQTTAGSWASANYRTITSETQVIATSGATFYITGVQLEKGSTATSFDYRPYGTELALCQRYYFQHSGAWNSTSFYYYPVMGRLGSATNASVVLQFPVTMRSAPTFTQTGAASTWINSGPGSTKGVTLATDVASTQSINLNATFSAISGGAAGQGIIVYQDGLNATSLAFNAEL